MKQPRLIKLVRDHTQTWAGPGRMVYQQIPADQRQRALEDKLIEEAVEYVRDPCIQELIDVLEVVRALADYHHHGGLRSVETLAEIERNLRGGFTEAIGLYGQLDDPDESGG